MKNAAYGAAYLAVAAALSAAVIAAVTYLSTSRALRRHADQLKGA